MRKKWLSRALAAVLTGVLAVGLLAGCGAEKKDESKAPAASSNATAASSSAAEVVEEEYVVSYPMDTDVELRVYIDTALGTYIQENTIKFIMGDRSLDEFDAFVAELDKMGLQDSLKIANDAYARFLGK